MRRRSVKGGIQDTTAEKLERITKDRPSWRDWRDGFNGPVRAGPGNPDPALRAADLVSAARRTDFYSSLRLLSGSLHFFLTALRHYPLNSAEVKRLRLHPGRYTSDSETVFRNTYDAAAAIRSLLHS
ncbi:hypothetical protein [Burkholderia cenocepacia]|uniref:hypothetical protein n=1 Tax=Burkholderia cenocepacia TaxID=95486 RepID=UPI00358DDF9D